MCYCHRMMTSTDDKVGGQRPARRRHDAEASRQALKQAAAQLFDERGYDATTIREIGERAEVDPALIARYFGNKEGLYLATVEDSPPAQRSGDPRELVERALTDGHVMRPVTRAMVSPTLSDAMRDRVSKIIASRTVQPLQRELEAKKAPQAQLRAELALATAIGVSLTRAGGTLPALRDATPAELLDVLSPVLEELWGGFE